MELTCGKKQKETAGSHRRLWRDWFPSVVVIPVLLYFLLPTCWRLKCAQMVRSSSGMSRSIHPFFFRLVSTSSFF